MIAKMADDTERVYDKLRQFVRSAELADSDAMRLLGIAKEVFAIVGNADEYRFSAKNYGKR